MNDVERVFHEDMQKQTYCEVVADDSFDIVDGIDFAGDDTDTSSESEEL